MNLHLKITALRRPFFVLVLIALLIVAGAVPSVAQSRPQIVSSIDNASLATLPHSHPQLSNALDAGAMDENVSLQRMLLVLSLAPEQQHALTTLLDRQQTPGTKSYQQWLTPQQFGQQFGPAPEDLAKITAWLQQQGFSVDKVAQSGMWIEFSGNVGQVNATFHTQMRHYQVNGEAHIANSMDVSIPAALRPLVKGVPLHDLFSRPTLVHADAGARPDITNSRGVNAIAPGDFATIYDLNPLYKAGLNGSGQTIAIVARSDVNLSDIATFQSIFGLPANVPNVIDNGPPPGVVPSGDAVEASLDVEWAAAVAPGATIDLVPTVNTATTDGAMLSASYIVDQNLAQIVNASFGRCEQDLGQAANAFWNHVWEQAAAQGMSVFVSSGDAGASGCADIGIPDGLNVELAVNGVGSTPFNTSVGGTVFDENGGPFWKSTNGPTLASAIGYIPEMVWNGCCDSGFALALGAGGGISTIYPTPSWQTLNVTGLQILRTYMLPGQPGISPRGVPDVSLTASAGHDPYVFCFTDPTNTGTPDCQLQNGVIGPHTFQNAGGGTSFASPTFAGIMAIINQKNLSDNATASPGGRQGLANYVLYPLGVAENFSSCNSSNRTDPAVAASPSCVFNDITVGNNTTLLGPTGYTAVLGYDLASGLGSVDVNNLASAWNSAAATFHGSETTLQTNPTSSSISINHGQSVTFSVTVQKLPGDAATQLPAGTVSLIAQGGTLASSVGVTAATLSGGSSPVTTGNFNVTNLPGGSYNLLANFPGDGFFAGSTSNSLPVTVAPESSAMTLSTTPPKYLTYGAILQIGVTITGTSGRGVPSGQVILSDGGTPFTQLSLNNEGTTLFSNCLSSNSILTPQASTVPCFSIGTHNITVTYSGDGSFNPSSQSTSLTIAKGVPGVGVRANPRATGSSTLQTTLTAYVGYYSVGSTAVPPTGTVQFMDGTTAIGVAPLVMTNSGSQASFQATLSQGTHQINGVYSGDNLYTPGIQNLPATVLVGVPIGWSATSTAKTINPGQTATYNLTVTAIPGFTGQVPITCMPGTDPLPEITPPNGVQCTVSPSTATFSATTTSVAVTATITTTTSARLTRPSPFGTSPLVLAGVFAFVTSLFAGQKAPKRAVLILAVAVLAAGISSCGHGSSSNNNHPMPPAVSATFTVWGVTPGSIAGETVYNGIELDTSINP